MKDSISLVAQKIAKRGKNIAFTGAGISTESGIPDYRSQGGIWDQFRPVYFDEFMSSKEARVEYWRQKTEMYQSLRHARPNPAHIALFRLYEMGLLEAVITQNIDGLHQASGLPDEKVVELHGSTRRIRCMSCGNLAPEDESYKRVACGDLAPECECGGYLKPDTISFGQAMPVAEMQQATELSRHCDVFMVVGSTLVVHPAASMPYHAKQARAFLAIVNLSETPCDEMCDVLIRDKAGKVLTALADEVMGLLS